MTRSGLLIGVGVLALATAALGSTGARTESSVALGKIAVYDNTRAVVIVSAADGRVLSKIHSDSIAGTGDLSPDGRWIAVETYPRPKGLVVQPVAGGRARTVARCSAKWCPGWPSWDGSGSELAYQQGPFIYTVFANGLGRTRVIRGETPDWSPGTPEIAFVRDFSYHTGAGKIYVAAIDGHDVRYVARGAYPSFHPSGKRLLFVRGLDIFTVSVAGGAPRRIIRNGFAPVWSPDGRSIAFSRFTRCPKPPAHGVCSGRIFILPASGIGNARPIGPEIGDIGRISWGR